MTQLPPLPIAIPLLAAALLTGAAPLFKRRGADILALITSTTVFVLCLLLAHRSAAAPVIYWFGGWKPHNGVSLGIGFVIDPLGAGLAALAAGLVTAALLFSWRYFEEVGTLYHALVLVFLAAMCGFCLSGDLFNLFVFFELMSVAAYALTGYKIEDKNALQAALNFAIVNSVGAFLVLMGITLLYGRTGALNLAQIGEALARGPADGLVVAAFVLITAGFLVKAAVVPFHFWLPDAHAAAPTPVCVLFSGVMVELGLYGAARIYWTVFSGPLGTHEARLRSILIGAGVLTVLWGGVMCWSQRHLKRLLAFSTVSHMGMLLVGIGLLSAQGLAGAALYALAHGLIKGSLFVCVGILLNRFSTADEFELRGKGKDMLWSGLLFFVAALGLAGLPPFMTSTGKSVIEEAARALSLPWVAPLFLVGSALTGGAILRAAGRVYLGWGREEGLEAGGPKGHEDKEVQAAFSHAPWMMILPAALLVAAALAAGLSPHLEIVAARSAQHFVDRAGYAAITLRGTPLPPSQPLSAGADRAGEWYACASAAGALLLALLSLHRGRLPSGLVSGYERVTRPVLGGMRSLQSGDVRDYVAWLIAGVATFGGLVAWALR